MSSWQNCSIAQSARHRICPVTQGAFYKAKRKKKQASLLSFPYRFNTTLNHLLSLSVGPPSISSLFLLYSISLIPLRLPTSLFGWVMARLSQSTERRESSLIWWKHFRAWPSYLWPLDWSQVGWLEAQWKSPVVQCGPGTDLKSFMDAVTHFPLAECNPVDVVLKLCFNLPPSAKGNNVGWSAHQNWAKHSESLIARR